MKTRNNFIHVFLKLYSPHTAAGDDDVDDDGDDDDEMMMMNDNDYLRYMMIPIMTRNIWSMFSAALVFHSSRPFAVNSRRSIAFVRFIKSVDILLPAQLSLHPG